MYRNAVIQESSIPKAEAPGYQHLLETYASETNKNGIRFGKGLQLVNILRDLPMDLRRGRCYIPESRLSEMNLRPQDLLNPSSMDRFRPLYETYLNLAADSLSAGWKYTLSLPFGCCRIRLACAWPALIGIRTLKYLSIGNVLDDRTRIKISRAEIRGIILRSIAFYLFPAPWSRLFERLGKPHR